MNILSLVILILVILAGFVALFFYIKRELVAQKPKEDTQSLLMLQNQVSEIGRALDNKLGESARMAQMGELARNELIRSVSEHLTRLQESNKQVLNFTDQLKNLQDILKNPKQ